MSHIDRQLDRLLRAASQAPDRDVPPISYTTESRTLAAWRAARAAGNGSLPILVAWRTGLAAAFATAMLCVGVSFAASGHIEDDVNDPYVAADPGVSIAMSTGWMP